MQRGDARQRGQFTAEFRALTADGARALDGRPRPGGHRLRAASRCASSARSSTSPTPGGRPSSGCRPCSARRRSPRWPPSSPTPRGSRSCAEIVLRGAAGARRRVQRAGRLRPGRRAAAAAHDQPARPTRSRATSSTPSPAWRSSSTTSQPTQYAAMHGRRVLLADREEAVARFPAMREGLEVLDIRAIAALPLRVEGRILGAFVAALVDRPRVRRRRRRGARGARRADRAERLAAAGRRRARHGRHRDARGEPAAAAARRGRPDPVGHAGHRRAGQRAGRARRPRPGRLVLDRRHRRAGPAARHGPRAPGPVPARGGRGLRARRWSP